MAFEIPFFLRELLKNPTENLVIAAIPLLIALYRLRSKPRRVLKVPYTQERVLVLGASSGIGRSVARQYSSRGARVCVVGRRAALLDEVVQECRNARPVKDCDEDVFSVAADFSSPEDMVLVRSVVEDGKFLLFFFSKRLTDGNPIVIAWGGLDTLVVAAGVSALQPLLTVAGSEAVKGTALPETTKEGIQRAVDVSLAAIRGNYTGPLVAAVTFVSTSLKHQCKNLMI
jgi:NAD(P)-dependent dehydrogenase (short-subunit alcohol dehydrogenase family)